MHERLGSDRDGRQPTVWVDYQPYLDLGPKFRKTDPFIFIQTHRLVRNEIIQADENRFIPVILQLFDSEVVIWLHFNIKALESYKIEIFL